MILVADSGSTKTEWKVIRDGLPLDSVFTSGINPFFLTGDEIYLMLMKEAGLIAGESFTKVYFYGTGINSEAKGNIVKEAVGRFVKCNDIFTGSDLLAAARSLCQDKQGIACIMGTGSNSCYYDGKVIAANVAPLGYILGDEGGAAVLGRKLISSVLKKQVPERVRELFFESYRMTPSEILENVYMKPFPNRFLGQFAKFISANIEIEELQYIIRSSFEEFINRNILQYPESCRLPVHFTGSIAWNFRTFLEELLVKNSLQPGIITPTPMKSLIEYHLRNYNKDLS